MFSLSARPLVAAAAFLGCAVLVAQATKAEPVPIRESLERFPLTIGHWSGTPAPPLADDVLKVLGVDEYMNRTYRSAGGIVGLYVGYYASQRQGDTIHSPLNCLPGAGWEPESRRYLALTVEDPTGPGPSPSRSVEINRYLIRKGADAQMVLYWYQSHGRVVANEYWSKVHMVLDAIRLNRTDAAMVRVIAPVRQDDPNGESRAEGQAIEFVRALFPVLARYLPS